jgi:HEAT repeat protein
VQALGDQDDRVYGAAISTLVSVGAPAVASLSRAVMDKREPWLLRKNAAMALGRMKCRVDTPVLLRALHDENRNVQQGAAWALGELRVEEAARPLGNLVLDASASWYTKAVAVSALGQIGSHEAYLALDALAARTDEVLSALRSGGTAPELQSLYGFLLRRHQAMGGGPLLDSDMRALMESAMIQFQEGLEAARTRAEG